MSAAGAQVAYDPRALAVYSEVDGACRVRVHDAAVFCARGEAVPFWTLQMRAQAAQQARAPGPAPPVRCQALPASRNGRPPWARPLRL